MKNILLPTILCVILSQILFMASFSVVTHVTADEKSLKDFMHEALFAEDQFAFDLLAATTESPTIVPSAAPTEAPTIEPSTAPTFSPSAAPSFKPTAVPTAGPTYSPTLVPSAIPTVFPTRSPTQIPSAQPSFGPTYIPTAVPTTVAPSPTPTRFPTRAPVFVPGSTDSPTIAPSQATTPVVSINSSFVISQVTDPVLSSNAIDTYLTAVATVAQVNKDNVHFLGYRILSQQGSSRRQLLVIAQQIVSQAITYTMELNSTIIIPLINYPQYQNNATAAGSNIVANIANSIATQDFTVTLQQTAQTNTATEFLLANVTSVTVAPIVVDVPPIITNTITESGSSLDTNLSAGEIAGVVIGVIFGLLLIIGGVYFFHVYMVTKHEDSTRITALADKYASEPAVIGPYSDDVLVISIEDTVEHQEGRIDGQLSPHNNPMNHTHVLQHQMSTNDPLIYHHNSNMNMSSNSESSYTLEEGPSIHLHKN